MTGHYTLLQKLRMEKLVRSMQKWRGTEGEVVEFPERGRREARIRSGLARPEP